MKKTFIAIAAVIIASASIFWACSKDSEETQNANIEDFVMNKNIIVGFETIQNGQRIIVPTYNEKNYSKALELSINPDKSTEASSIVEDVDIFFFGEEQKPVLKVAIFDITNDKSSNIYIYLREIKTNSKAASTCYALPLVGGNSGFTIGDVIVECTSNVVECSEYGPDGKITKRGCEPEGKHCTPCATAAPCTQKIISTSTYSAICNAF